MSPARFVHTTCAAIACAIFLACAESPVAPTASTASRANALALGYGSVDISGVWSFHEDATEVFYSQAPGDGSQVYRCSTDGTYTFAQIGESLTGSYDQVGTCTASDGSTIPNNFTGVTLTGSVVGRHVRWATADGCFLEGTVIGRDLNELRGGGKCRLQGFGAYVTSWSATR